MSQHRQPLCLSLRAGCWTRTLRRTRTRCFSQGRLPHRFLRRHVELLRLIGQGSRGAAFDCRLLRLPLSMQYGTDSNHCV
jgi:hypothetical protein